MHDFHGDITISQTLTYQQSYPNTTEVTLKSTDAVGARFQVELLINPQHQQAAKHIPIAPSPLKNSAWDAVLNYSLAILVAQISEGPATQHVNWGINQV